MPSFFLSTPYPNRLTPHIVKQFAPQTLCCFVQIPTNIEQNNNIRKIAPPRIYGSPPEKHKDTDTFMIPRIITAASLAVLTSHVSADSTWQLGLGKSISYSDPARSYSRSDNSSHTGFAAQLAYLHSSLVGVRTHLYHIDGQNDVQGWGNELQVLLGYNLNADGLRAYTGPAWFRENRKDTTVKYDKNETFSGYGWHVGFAYQWQGWSADVSATIRDNSDYVDYYEAKYSVQDSNSVSAVSGFFTLAYQL